MRSKTKIAIDIPNVKDENRYFSLRLQQRLLNEQSVFDTSSRIFVVSDIEGNFKGFYRLLIASKIIDKYFDWIFEDGHLVIVGDCFDRGEQVTECLWLIYSLEEKAKKAGGYVHFILGNHEIMNMNGDWRYVHPKYAANNSSIHAALYDGSNELWRWLRTKNIIEKIGDTLFVHAGIAPELLKSEISISEINNLARPYYTQANGQYSNLLLKTLFNSESSPFWYRGYYREGASDKLIDATLQQYGVNTIVTGHTMIDKITAFFSGKVINVNTDHAAGNSEALLIKKDRFYRIDNKGKKERIK
jgi:hypothetical protein